MKWFINLSTRAKLILGFGAMWLLLAIVIVTAYLSITGISQSEKELHEVNYSKALDLRQLRAHINLQHGQILEMMVTTDKSRWKTNEQLIHERAQQIDEIVERLLKTDLDPECQKRLKEIKNTLAAYRQTREEQIALIRQGKMGKAIELGLGIQGENIAKIRSLAQELGDKEDKEVDERMAADMQTAKQSLILFAFVGLVAFLLGSGMIVFLSHTIARPLIGISKVAQQIAAGDLSVSVPADQRTDEIGTLAQAFRQMVENLRRSTADISEAVNLLGSSASEILAATTQVASGTAETATAISETTTTVEEVRQAAQLSSQKAKNVSDNAQRVAEVTQTGQKAVEETAAVMRHIRDQMESIAQTIVRLSEQGQSIGGIIASVTDIADQSNLLAVNAAIEAAKAGEQGKGFAVVAQEIKSLAEQSKQATAQVRGILSEVQKATSAAVMATEQGSKAVDAGVKQSAQSGEAIRALAESTGEAVQAATQIVASSQQQVVGMDQIGTAMENINQAGAETAASMRQAEVSAQNLHELGQKLKRLVEQYKI
ncbi:MAG: HAMP domain-containing methyl-accepting chemotaxis protein [Syntrophales bacterium]